MPRPGHWPDMDRWGHTVSPEQSLPHSLLSLRPGFQGTELASSLDTPPPPTRCDFPGVGSCLRMDATPSPPRA